MKDKLTAVLLAFFLGTFGVHRFYLNQNGLGILYIILGIVTCGVLSPVLGLIDAIIWLLMSDEAFNRKFNRDYMSYQQPAPVHLHVHGNNNENKVVIQQGGEFSKATHIPPTQMGTSPRARKVPQAPKVEQQKPVVQNPNKTEGVVRFKNFEFKGAIESFEKALLVQPKDVATHFNLGCCYSMEEDIDTSLYHLDKAVALGFKDFDRIDTHDALSYLRSHDEFLDFQRNGYRLVAGAPLVSNEDKDLLDSLGDAEQEEVLDLHTPTPEKEVIILSQAEIENQHSQNQHQNKSNSLFDEIFGDKETSKTIEDRIDDTPVDHTPSGYSSGDDLISKLRQLADLRDKGILTEEEFQDQKRKLLG